MGTKRGHSTTEGDPSRGAKRNKPQSQDISESTKANVPVVADDVVGADNVLDDIVNDGAENGKGNEADDDGTGEADNDGTGEADNDGTGEADNDGTGEAVDDASDHNDDTISNKSGHSAHSLALRDTKVSGKDTGTGLERETVGGKGKEVTNAPAAPSSSPATVSKANTQGKLSNPKILTGKDWGYTNKVNNRVSTARDLASPQTDTFSIAKVPANTNWIQMDDPDKPRFYALALKGSNKPLKIWAVGNVTRSYFFDAHGNAPYSVSLNVNSLDKSDNTVGNNLLVRNSVPRVPPESQFRDLQFRKWTSVRRPGDTMMTNEVFSEVYDARHGIKLPRTKMNQYPVEMLKKGDLVLVEATVQRYHMKNDKKTDYSKWTAFYSLEFIALLSDTAPPTTLAAKLCEKDLELDF